MCYHRQNKKTMNTVIAHDHQNLENILNQASRYGLDFLKDLNAFPTGRGVVSTKNQSLPQKGMGVLSALAYFDQHYKDILVASSGPRYWGYVTGGTTPAAIVGDWLTSVFDQNTQSENGPGDASAVIEKEAIRFLLDLFQLPAEKFHGGFVSGATMSNFTCLAVARQWVGKYYNIDIAKEGIQQHVECIGGAPHSSSIKSLAMLGMGSRHIRLIPCLPNREAIDINALEAILSQKNGEPVILISSGGTVNTVDFDDMAQLAQLKKKYNFWWHIDAAFGGFAACVPEYQHLLKGWELADSITIDAHKWLNVPYDSAVFFIRKEHALLQTETFQNSNAPYLGDPMENFSYLNFLPENSRRFRALPVWFSLMAYGQEGFQEIVSNCIALAQEFGEKITESASLELLAPVRLNVVAFTFKNIADAELKELIPKFMKKLDERGKVFMTPTSYNGRLGLRAAFVNWQTAQKDLTIALDEIQVILNELCSKAV